MLLRMAWVVVSTSLALAGTSWAQLTEFEDCLGPGSLSCSYAPGAVLDSLCGHRFYEYQGIVAWPALRNVGPITISVRTRSIGRTTIYPLLVEISHRTGLGCYPGRDAMLALMAFGADQCGGTTESVGPLDLTQFGIRDGALYSIQVVFFRFVPEDFPPRLTVGLECVHVKVESTAVMPVEWSGVKVLYR
jgi:hypothetical protein